MRKGWNTETYSFRLFTSIEQVDMETQHLVFEVIFNAFSNQIDLNNSKKPLKVPTRDVITFMRSGQNSYWEIISDLPECQGVFPIPITEKRTF